mmetsp:Transcript_18796/g.35051  ORF Transcript_18796/g.35051 Transcript_18796/m.35051 type:complete len:81 (+) Transcript_18796:37-279(+)
MLFFVVGHSLETVGNAHYMCSTERAKKKRKSVRPPTLSFILQLQPTTPPSTRQENKEFVFVANKWGILEEAKKDGSLFEQ